MNRCSGALPRCWPIVFSLLVMACVSTSRVLEPSFGQEYLGSRNNSLRYKLPGGWLNVANDPTSLQNIIWLVRGDFGATLVVKEVSVDAGTRRNIERTGLKRIAELTLGLASGDGGIRVVMPPEESSLRGAGVCTYEYLTSQSGDRVRVILLDTRANVYEIQMLMTTKMSVQSTAESVAVQDAFVRHLAW